MQHQDNLPFYGLHQKQSFKDREFDDIRNMPIQQGESFELEQLKVYGCVIAEAFKAVDEEELGRLYCYVDAARSMAENIDTKMIHGDCVLCGDEYCSFSNAETTETEQNDFSKSNVDWKKVDPKLYE